MRLIQIVGDELRMVRVYFNYTDMEYVCQLFINGRHYKPADYFTDDKDDAIATAEIMFKGN